MHLNPGKRKTQHVVFQHGWGFPGRCWHEWYSPLSQGSFQVLDRGYSGNLRKLNPIPRGAYSILVCHSLGLHFVMDYDLSAFDMVVILSGFAYFHGESPGAGRFTRRHIKRMKRRLELEPDNLLADFYRDCSWDYGQIDNSLLDPKRLQRDLEMLDQSHLKEGLCDIPEIVLFHGRKDRVVPIGRADELHEKIGGRLIVFEDAGHGLPFTHHKAVMSTLQDLI